MVEPPPDNSEDLIREALTNQKSSDSMADERSTSQHLDNKSSEKDCNKSSSDSVCGLKNFSECSTCRNEQGTTSPKVFHSNGNSRLPFDEHLPVCKSVEDLSDGEFVVCDKDKLEADVQHYKGDCTVIKDWNESDTEVMISEHDTSSKEGNQKKDNEKFESECAMQNDEHRAGGITDNQTTSDRKSEREDKFPMEDDGLSTEQNNAEMNSYSLSIEDVINEIDSNVVIDVQDAVSEMEVEHSEDRQDSLEMFAVCKELLDIKDGTVRSNLGDMQNCSCHSIENLVDDGDVISEDLLDNDSSHKVHFENVSDSIHTGIESGRMETKFSQQKSESDGSDSGIHVDTDVNSYHDSESIPSSTSKNEGEQGLVSHSDNQELSSDSESGSRKEEVSVKLRNKENSSKQEHFKLSSKHMSLDLAVSYHPGQKSADSSPQKMSWSPVSPLSPGSRSFKPKLYSVQRKIAQSPIQLFRQLPIVKNMYMSPLLAPDEALKGLPPVHLTVSRLYLNPYIHLIIQYNVC